MSELDRERLDPRSTAAELLKSVRSVGLETGADLALSLLYAAFRDRSLLARAISEFRSPDLLDWVARSNYWLPDGFLQRAGEDGGLAVERAARAVLDIGDAHDRSRVQNLADVFEAVLDARAAMSGKGHGAWATNASLAQLMAQVVVRPGDVVLDPACGIGNTLMAAADLGASRLIGVDVNETVAALAAMRFEVNQISVELQLRNSLTQPRDERANTVLLEPPSGLRDPELLSRLHDMGLKHQWNSAEFAWIGRSLGLLKTGGRAAVLLPPLR